MLPCGVKRQTTRHLRQTATNLPANEDTSSFAFRVVGRTNFAVPRSPAATLIVIYDRGYFPCAPRIHLLFAYRSTALARLRTDRTIHLRRVRGFASPRFVPPAHCHHFSHDRPRHGYTSPTRWFIVDSPSPWKPLLRETLLKRVAYFHADPSSASFYYLHTTESKPLFYACPDLTESVTLVAVLYLLYSQSGSLKVFQHSSRINHLRMYSARYEKHLQLSSAGIVARFDHHDD